VEPLVVNESSIHSPSKQEEVQLDANIKINSEPWSETTSESLTMPTSTVPPPPTSVSCVTSAAPEPFHSNSTIKIKEEPGLTSAIKIKEEPGFTSMSNTSSVPPTASHLSDPMDTTANDISSTVDDEEDLSIASPVRKLSMKRKGPSIQDDEEEIINDEPGISNFTSYVLYNRNISTLNN